MAMIVCPLCDLWPKLKDSNYCEVCQMSMDIGTDWSMGQSNVDKDSGIHYGIIPANDIPYIWDHVEADYGEASCPKCGSELLEYDDEEHGEYSSESGCSDYACKNCELVYDSSECFSDEPLGHTFEDSEYCLSVDSQGDLWVLSSPYYTLAAYCSPCAPGAGYITNQRENGIQTYCLGAEWWPEGNDVGPCPYSVWSVEDDTLVYAPPSDQDDTED